MAARSDGRARATAYFRNALEVLSGLSDDGAVHFTCADWRHSADFLAAGEEVYGAPLDLIVWAREEKAREQGAFYRSGYELIFA